MTRSLRAAPIAVRLAILPGHIESLHSMARPAEGQHHPNDSEVRLEIHEADYAFSEASASECFRYGYSVFFGPALLVYNAKSDPAELEYFNVRTVGYEIDYPQPTSVDSIAKQWYNITATERAMLYRRLESQVIEDAKIDPVGREALRA